MKNLGFRLTKLETRMAAALDGVASWLGQAAEVEERALRRLSTEDLVFLSDLFAVDDARQRNELIRTNPSVWHRWLSAWA